MSESGVPASLDHVVIAPISIADNLGIEAAVRLGDESRATLGLMPADAYYQAATEKRLLVARIDHAVVAYALYGLSNRVRLDHLCVGAEYRGRGIARKLVEWISARHADYPGISVRCRSDYGLGDMWAKLGFSILSEAPGRSRAGHLVVNWWRDHLQPQLFSRSLESVLVRAAIDMNVLRDLVDAARPRESQALITDQITDRLELVRTSALEREINSLRDDNLRRACIAEAEGLSRLRANATEVHAARSQLMAAVAKIEPDFPSSAADELDLAHVADAVAAGLNVFITRDIKLSRLFGPIVGERFGLQILSPAEVVVRIDELVRSEAYRPAAVMGTSFKMQSIGRDSELDPLRREIDGERAGAFSQMIRDAAIAGHERSGIYGPDGRLLAAFIVEVTGSAVIARLLRVADSGLADTLARQLVFLLRMKARDRGVSLVQITDPHPSREIRLAMSWDGFRVDEHGHSYALVLDVCDAASEVERLALEATRGLGVQPPTLRAGMPADASAELERVWWPAKIVDSDLPTYLVPIRQSFSRELLGVPSGLFPRDALGLSREHVYYRSAAGARPRVPARLLWYMSDAGPRAPLRGSVIACSQLESVVVDGPVQLHGRYQHLGVWSLNEVEGVAYQGRVQAWRFSNTEIFPRALSLGRLRSLALGRGVNVVLRGPSAITSELFGAAYQEGWIG